MEMSHEFEVSSPLAETWAVLTDIERIAPCMPGAELRGIEDDEFRGVVKVKLGAITAEYRGAARFVEKDDTAHRAVLRAEGREARGQGRAAATITARLAPRGSGTKVSVATDLQITGRVAQFGRGVLAEVSSTLLGQFVDNLETTVLKDGPKSHESEVGGSSSARTSADTNAWRAQPVVPEDSRIAADRAAFSGDERQPVEPVDLFAVARGPIARRVLPGLAVLALVVIALAIIRRVLGRDESEAKWSSAIADQTRHRPGNGS